MAVEISNGPLDLHSSGTFIIDSRQKTTIKTIHANESLTFIMVFTDVFSSTTTTTTTSMANMSMVPASPELSPKTTTRIINDTTLELTFHQFVNPLGTFSRELIVLGSLADRKLYFAYVITAFSGTQLKSFAYTFYLGEAVKNG